MTLKRFRGKLDLSIVIELDSLNEEGVIGFLSEINEEIQNRIKKQCGNDINVEFDDDIEVEEIPCLCGRGECANCN